MLGNLLRARTVGLGKNHRKLLAAVTRHQIRRSSHIRRDHVSQFAQRLIPCLMAMPVVERLEVIGVDHHHRQRFARALGTKPFMA